MSSWNCVVLNIVLYLNKWVNCWGMEISLKTFIGMAFFKNWIELLLHPTIHLVLS